MGEKSSRKASKPSRESLEAENRLLKRSHWVDGVTGTLNRLITVGGFVAIAYFINHSIVALAGEKTIADIGVRFLGDVRVSESLAWVTAILCGGYGAAQRKMRRSAEQRLGERIRQLEATIDPDRSGSGLTPRRESPQ
jgi:hypothetical protein